LAIFYNLWVIFTLVLFYAGPVDWPGRSSPSVLLLVGACLLLFNVGSWLGSRKHVTPRVTVSIFENHISLTFLIIALNFALTEWWLRVVTGLSIAAPSAYSLDFGAVYANYLETVSRLPPPDRFTQVLVLLKAAMFGTALYLISIYFPKRPLIAVALLAPMVASSFLRGTDKEFVDIGVIVCVLFFLKARTRSFWLVVSGVAGVVLLFFAARKLGRYPDLPLCIWEGEVCRSADSILGKISPELEFVLLMVTTYVTNGYQALSIAMTLPFEANYGAAHLPAIKSALCARLDLLCTVGTYETRLIEAGWPSGSRWTSVYPVIANDLTWYFTPLYFLFIGALYGFSSKMWKLRNDYLSLVTIVLISIFFMYSSANMQLSISYDWLIPTLVAFGVQTVRLCTPSRPRARNPDMTETALGARRRLWPWHDRREPRPAMG